MKDRLIITVSEVNSTKSYNIHQLVKKSIIIVIIIACVIIAGSITFIKYLSDEIKEVKISKELQIKNLTKKSQNLLAQNSFYSEQIKGKVKDIEALSSKLDDIEEIIGLKKDDKKDKITRATLAKITSSQKTYMQKVIPTGSPLLVTITKSKFGYRNHPIKKRRKFHRGIDLKAKFNTEVRATADGVVKFVRARDVGDFGRVVIISHNFGFESVYAHLNKTKVKLGDIVSKNDLIALTGSSGRSTGPHLHYEVRHANKVLNPKDFMDWNLKNYEELFTKQRRVQWESLILMINKQHKLVQQ
ncbi:MAG: M23 family metallopeptidase [Campylobacteraceae bacterium]|nr:M23 family metallopeptidase [Campylobacteraceae bacterium]